MDFDKGVALAMDAYRGDRSCVSERWGWVGGSNSWNIVSNGSINVGMLAISVRASAFQEGNGSENAIDGNLATRWSAEGDQWIEFDLGTETETFLAGLNELES